MNQILITLFTNMNWRVWHYEWSVFLDFLGQSSAFWFSGVFVSCFYIRRLYVLCGFPVGGGVVICEGKSAYCFILSRAHFNHSYHIYKNNLITIKMKKVVTIRLYDFHIPSFPCFRRIEFCILNDIQKILRFLTGPQTCLAILTNPFRRHCFNCIVLFKIHNTKHFLEHFPLSLFLIEK